MSSLGRIAPGTTSVSTSACSTNASSVPRPGRVPVVPGASSDPWSSPDSSRGRSSLTGADDRPVRATRQRKDAAVPAGRKGSRESIRGRNPQSAAPFTRRRRSVLGSRMLSRGRIWGPEQLAQRALGTCAFPEGRRAVGAHRPSAHDQRHGIGRVGLPQARGGVVGRHRDQRVRAAGAAAPRRRTPGRSP